MGGVRSLCAACISNLEKNHPVRAVQKHSVKENDMAKKIEVPIWEKINLTLEEASAYFGIGVNKLREIANSQGDKVSLYCGSKRLIKRKQMQNYLNGLYSI